MGILFTPSVKKSVGPKREFELMTICSSRIEKIPRKKRHTRCVSIDFRMSADVIKEIPLAKVGNYASAVYEDDGSWIIQFTESDDDGYTIKECKQLCNAGGIEIRVSATIAQAKQLFPDYAEGVKRIYHDLVGHEGNKLYFVPSHSDKRVVFIPRHRKEVIKELAR